EKDLNHADERQANPGSAELAQPRRRGRDVPLRHVLVQRREATQTRTGDAAASVQGLGETGRRAGAVGRAARLPAALRLLASPGRRTRTALQLPPVAQEQGLE